MSFPSAFLGWSGMFGSLGEYIAKVNSLVVVRLAGTLANCMKAENEFCSLCGCMLHRSGEYATPTLRGRSHATKHHYVPERFFGRSMNRKGSRREGIFTECPWEHEGETAVYCYECHEELLHNPVLLPEDVAAFAALVKARGFAEDKKPEGREKIGGRIILLHEVIVAGLKALSEGSKVGLL
jgi:hypothetical protein